MRWRPVIIIASALVSIEAGAVTRSHRGILEVAPLRGVFGQVAGRAELPLTPEAAVGAGYETTETPSERDGSRDRSISFNAEGIWYLTRMGAFAPFLAGGIREEEGVAYRETRRDDRTGSRTYATEMHDRWTDHGTYWSTTQTMGCRWLDGPWLTASLRWTREEVAVEYHHSKVEEINSDDPDLSSAGRPVVRQHISLHAGILIP